MSRRMPCVSMALAAAAALGAAAATAPAQDSVAPPDQTPRSGDALDAYQAAPPSQQAAGYVVDLAPLSSSWGNRYAIAPLIKASRSTQAPITHLNHLIGSAAASPLMARGTSFPRGSYLAWAAAGQGVHPAFNQPPTDNGTGQFGLLSVAGLRSHQFGAAMLEFGAGPDGSFGTGDDENNIVAATANLLTRRVNRLYVSRTAALTSKAAPGPAGANTSNASLGLGSVDEHGVVHVLADGFGLLAPGRLQNKTLVRVATGLRTPAAVNHLQNSGAADGPATAILSGVPAGSVLSTPSLVPSSLAGRPILLAADFASQLLVETAPGAVTPTIAHLPTADDSSRGSASFVPQVFAPLASAGGNDAGLVAMLARSDLNTSTRAIALAGMTASGAPAGRLVLTLPESGLIDPTDGFQPGAAFPPQIGHQFTSYQGRPAFRGGNGQVAAAVLPSGDLLAAAVVAATGHPGELPASPNNYIAVARVSAATGQAVWTIAAHTGDATGATGGSSKAIRQDADGDGVLDKAPVGRLALRSELPGAPNGPSLSAPAMDRDGNLYFLASVRLDHAPVANFTTALLRANHNPAAGPAGSYELELLTFVGQVVRGPNSQTDYRIDYLSVADADGPDPGSIWSGSIVQDRLPLVTSSELPYGSPAALGSLVFRARILYDADGDGLFLDPALPGNQSSNDQAYSALMVIMPRFLPGDANRDGRVNSADISAFLSLWLADVATGTLQADWDASGSVNSSDIAAFLSDWLASVGG